MSFATLALVIALGLCGPLLALRENLHIPVILGELLAGIVFGRSDRTMFVPPPEAVAESFMRQLATGRYARALPYLSDDLAARTTPDTLRALTDRLQNRTGKILDG